MNRRGFLEKMLAAGSAFTILPSATLYTRRWHLPMCPEGVFDPSLYMGEWQFTQQIIFRRSPWARLIDKGEFPEGMGNVASSLTYERSELIIGEKLWTSLNYEAH